ncbi:hypothetical protein EB75_17055 [Mycobacterium sp. ST-F2]|uniref:PRC-barrel domain-containing protein n=1 Tax=Mycobacterium sp. ST-F2 TaxID=1490484 RepID=UPI00093AAAE8|nr:PRC-barrel domain-containing protein [Mycobacterium sp. ST-F2]OKH81344.1 hypothetical protein EB75_17055 [Mycobacterium sp. ST-F2]
MSDAVSRFVGATVYDLAGGKIGKVHRVYVDPRTGHPKWASVRIGLFGGSESFVPLVGARGSDGSVRVAVAKNIVRNAPRVDGCDRVTALAVAKLLRHYGMPAGHATGLRAAQQQSSTAGRHFLEAAAAAAGIGGTAANTSARTTEPELPDQ